MNRLRLIFMQVTPVFQTFVTKWQLDELKDLGYESIVADFSPVVNKDIDLYMKQERMHSIPELNIIYKRFTSEDEIERFFKDYSDSGFFFTMFYNYYKVRKIFRFLKKYNIRYACLCGLASEFRLDKGSEINLSLKEKLNYQHIKAAIYHRVVKKILPRKNPDFIAIASKLDEEYQCKMNQCGKKVKMVYAHTYNYESFLRTEAYDNNGKKYCVFLDSYIPYHPDMIIDASLKVSPEDYYKEVNLIFNVIRQKYDIDIIIAAHPRADYSDKQNCYPNCKIFYGKSAGLVKGAEFVLAQFSDSISYGVMGNKPILIIDNAAISRIKGFNDKCQKYAKLLDLNIVCSPSDEIGDLYKYNEQAYAKFMNERVAYRIPQSPCMWKIVTDNIERRSL